MSRPPPPNPAMPYREDCWSEGATSTLIDAWGGRYLELSRGNLRQKDWQEVADSVNSRAAAAKRPPRTDSQCKNRIDTLKKKYKAERARISDSNGALDSRWQFYPRLDVLIGAAPSLAPAAGKNPPLALPLPSNRKASPLPIALALNDSLRRNYSAAAAAAAAASAEGDSSSSASSSREIPAKRRRGRHEDEEEDGIQKLADAITGFAEIYEKVEGEKQRQTLEMEERRLEFMKGVELQRMQAFVDSQIQMEKLKRAGRDDAGEQGFLKLFLSLSSVPH